MSDRANRMGILIECLLREKLLLLPALFDKFPERSLPKPSQDEGSFECAIIRMKTFPGYSFHALCVGTIAV